MNSSATAEIVITHEVGLHARPSVKLTKLAKQFPCSIEVAMSADGPWIDAKSIVKVMGARAPKGTTLMLRAEGEKSNEAVNALRDLVERDFDENMSDAKS